MEHVGTEHFPPICQNKSCVELAAFMDQRSADWLQRVEELEKELELVRAQNDELLAELAERKNAEEAQCAECESAEERCAKLEMQLSLLQARYDDAWRTFAKRKKNAKRHAELEDRCSELELKLFVMHGNYNDVLVELAEHKNAEESRAKGESAEEAQCA